MTWYLLCLAASVLLATAFYALRCRSIRTAAVTLPLMAVLGFVFAKLLYVLPMITVVLHKYGAVGLVRPDIEEFSIWGGVAGVSLAVALGAALTGKKPGEALDAFAPAGALLLCGARASEYFLTPGFLHRGLIGLGNEVEEGLWLCRFPFAVMDEWGMWYEAIFMLEAAIALIAVLLALTLFARRFTFMRTLYVMMAGQLFTEMLHSQSIVWSFVHVEQIYCAAAMLFILFLHCRHSLRDRGAFTPCLYAVGMYGVVVFLEFELDKSWISGLLYEIGSDFAMKLAEYDATFCYAVLLLIVVLLLVLEAVAVARRVPKKVKW